jgi:hypothetical protein
VTLESNNTVSVPVFGPMVAESIKPVCFGDSCYLQFASILQPGASSGTDRQTFGDTRMAPFADLSENIHL